jgi:predicted transcriptional regulator
MCVRHLLSAFRRWYFRAGRPIREIHCRTGLSRNTIRKHPASSKKESCYRRPKFPSQGDEYEPTLTSGLHGETTRPCKQHLAAKHLHQDLV